MVGSGVTAHDPLGRGHREANPTGRSLDRQGEARRAHRTEGRVEVQVPNPVGAIVAVEARPSNQGSEDNANSEGGTVGGTGVVAGACAPQSDDLPPALPLLIPAEFPRKR